MGKGIDAARCVSPIAAGAMEDMLEQALIVFLKRLGGSVDVPLEEIDGTGNDLLFLSLQGRIFHFEIRKKQ